MAQSIKIIWVAVLWTFIIGFLVTSAAQARHHKKKGHPKPTPTTSTRIYNPRDMPD